MQLVYINIARRRTLSLFHAGQVNDVLDEDQVDPPPKKIKKGKLGLINDEGALI
jgi:hypothetical protein